MVLVLRDSVSSFTGLVLDIHSPRARGIFDLEQTSSRLQESVVEFFENRGVVVAMGYRPGIGAAAGGPTGLVAQLLKMAPVVGKAAAASVEAFRVLRRKLADYKKKKMRPFEPTLGLHLDIWPAPDRRSRTSVAALVETLSLLPPLCTHMESTHPGISVSFLITSNQQRETLPPVRIDSDACNATSMMGLASKVQKDMNSNHPPTHYSVSRRWGFLTKTERHHDASGAFHFVFLFPES